MKQKTFTKIMGSEMKKENFSRKNLTFAEKNQNHTKKKRYVYIWYVFLVLKKTFGTK